MNGEARNFLQASGRVFYHPESIGERTPVIPSATDGFEPNS